jgi:hypothetical protein
MKKGIEMKRFLLVAIFTLVTVSPVNAQSTLSLQEKCAEGALKYYRQAIDPYLDSKDEVAISYHYSKKLDKCFMKVDHPGKGYREEIYDVYENKVIAAFVTSQGIWFIEDKLFSFDKTEFLSASKKFHALIKPYMEE